MLKCEITDLVVFRKKLLKFLQGVIAARIKEKLVYHMGLHEFIL